MAGRRGRRAEVRDIDAEALSANDVARISRGRDRVTRALRLARQQLAEASAVLVEREPKKARWYCMQVEGRSEFTVEKLLADAGVHVLLPKQKWVSAYKGKRIEGERPLFPGYLLVRIVPSAAAFEGLRMQRGVAEFVGDAKGYHIVVDKDVALFERLSSEQLVRMEADKTIGQGCEALIEKGPFAGFRCVVLDVKWARMATGKVRIIAGDRFFIADNMPIAFLKKL